MSNDWTNKLRDHLADYQEPVKDDLWAAIEQSLAQQKTIASSHGATKYRMMVRRFSMAAAIAALAVGGAYVYLHPWQQETRPRIVSVKAKKSVMEMGENHGQENLIASAVLEKSAHGDGVPVMSKVLKKVLDVSLQDSGLVAMASECVEASLPESPICTAEDVARQTKPKGKSMERRQEVQPMTDEPVAKKHRSHSWSMKVYGENTFASNGSNVSRPAFVLSDMPVDATFFSAAPLEEPKPKHHQPFSVGMQVGVGLTERLRLTTGVVYTQAASDLDAVTTQKLHYVGIPLSLSYQVWGTRRFHTYLTVGGEGAINVKNQTEVDGEAVESKRDRMQWSANAAVGVQYDLVPQIGVYVEPGAKYYFDNGSQIKNIFKDKKLNFNFQFGLRWNIGKE